MLVPKAVTVRAPTYLPTPSRTTPHLPHFALLPLKTCSKLAISFWDYLGARLKIPDADIVPWLPDLIRQNASG
jgi:hypothetical protein